MQGKPPTYKEIAARAGVSAMSVSLALRNHASLPPATRERIRAVAEEMGYRPNPLVSTLMSYVRNTRATKYQATLGLVTAFETRDNWAREGPARLAAEGVRARAGQLGYAIDEVWVKEPGMTSRRITEILRARGIHGLVIPGLPQATGHLSLDWSEFAVAAMGYSLRKPDLHRVVNHQLHTIRLALRELKRRGYRRIGLALPAFMNQRSDGNWVTGFLGYQHTVPNRQRVPLFVKERLEKEPFAAWFEKHTPDAVVAIHEKVPNWMKELGCRLPEDAAFVHLDWTPSMENCAGVDQNSHMVGAAAVDSVVAQLNRNERGIPAHPKVTMIEGTWVEGATVRSREAR